VPTPELPSFDLVVATVGRVSELDRLLDSLQRQTHDRLRVILVDQNEDERLAPVVERHARLAVVRVRSGRGLSRARNRGLQEVTSDVVAFPDDDCVYPEDLLARVGRRLQGETLAGVTGRAVNADGRSERTWKADPTTLTEENLWNRAISYTIFLRADVVGRVGSFDEELGLGSGTRWSSGEEIDYLVRAIRLGSRIAYDPAITVIHDERARDLGAARALRDRDGASVGYILRKHRYPARTLGRMLVRPLGGALLSLARLDPDRARLHLATLRGRLAGYRGARP
jgi:glycosyltransferase involved in cell wall biosynthesis